MSARRLAEVLPYAGSSPGSLPPHSTLVGLVSRYAPNDAQAADALNDYRAALSAMQRYEAALGHDPARLAGAAHTASYAEGYAAPHRRALDALARLGARPVAVQGSAAVAAPTAPPAAGQAIAPAPVARPVLTPAQVAARARAHIDAQAQLGIEVEPAEAVDHVLRGFSVS
jgi:hypothetical protein